MGPHPCLLLHLDQHFYGAPVGRRLTEGKGCRLHIRWRLPGAASGERLDALNEVSSTYIGHDALGKISEALQRIGRREIKIARE
jgi:hypothetical protein